MPASNSFIQVPPDSTGKKLYMQQHTVDGSPVQAQVMIIGDYEHANHFQYVDQRGQASVRFAEGSPTMDALGNLRVGTAQALGVYEHSNGPMSDLYTETTTSGGAINYDAVGSQVTLSTTTANGSSASRTTNRYHFYQPGVGNLIIQTLALGDSGKVGNTRQWGYFDDDNGIFWELAGTTLNVVVRSNVTGSIVETRIPQASWNSDPLDGSGISGMTLDVTKANFYFIDFAWLGVGVVRFGVLSPDGSRWAAHAFQNPNSNINPWSATATLPLSYRNFNTAGTGGSSEMRHICAAVYAESRTDYTFWRFCIDRETPITVTTNTPLLTVKPSLTYNGKPNRVSLYPESLNVLVTGGDVAIKIVDDAVLSGDTFVAGPETALKDVSATSYTGGELFKTFWLSAGCHIIDLAQFYELNDEGYHLLADGSDSYSMTIAATKLTGTTVQVAVSLNYRELR